MCASVTLTDPRISHQKVCAFEVQVIADDFPFPLASSTGTGWLQGQPGTDDSQGGDGETNTDKLGHPGQEFYRPP